MEQINDEVKVYEFSFENILKMLSIEIPINCEILEIKLLINYIYSTISKYLKKGIKNSYTLFVIKETLSSSVMKIEFSKKIWNFLESLKVYKDRSKIIKWYYNSLIASYKEDELRLFFLCYLLFFHYHENDIYKFIPNQEMIKLLKELNNSSLFLLKADPKKAINSKINSINRYNLVNIHLDYNNLIEELKISLQNSKYNFDILFGLLIDQYQQKRKEYAENEIFQKNMQINNNSKDTKTFNLNTKITNFQNSNFLKEFSNNNSEEISMTINFINESKNSQIINPSELKSKKFEEKFDLSSNFKYEETNSKPLSINTSNANHFTRNRYESKIHEKDKQVNFVHYSIEGMRNINQNSSFTLNKPNDQSDKTINISYDNILLPYHNRAFQQLNNFINIIPSINSLNYFKKRTMTIDKINNLINIVTNKNNNMVSGSLLSKMNQQSDKEIELESNYSKITNLSESTNYLRYFLKNFNNIYNYNKDIEYITLKILKDWNSLYNQSSESRSKSKFSIKNESNEKLILNSLNNNLISKRPQYQLFIQDSFNISPLILRRTEYDQRNIFQYTKKRFLMSVSLVCLDIISENIHNNSQKFKFENALNEGNILINEDIKNKEAQYKDNTFGKDIQFSINENLQEIKAKAVSNPNQSCKNDFKVDFNKNPENFNLNYFTIPSIEILASSEFKETSFLLKQNQNAENKKIKNFYPNMIHEINHFSSIFYPSFQFRYIETISIFPGLNLIAQKLILNSSIGELHIDKMNKKESIYKNNEICSENDTLNLLPFTSLIRDYQKKEFKYLNNSIQSPSLIENENKVFENTKNLKNKNIIKLSFDDKQIQSNILERNLIIEELNNNINLNIKKPILDSKSNKISSINKNNEISELTQNQSDKGKHSKYSMENFNLSFNLKEANFNSFNQIYLDRIPIMFNKNNDDVKDSNPINDLGSNISLIRNLDSFNLKNQDNILQKNISQVLNPEDKPKHFENDITSSQITNNNKSLLLLNISINKKTKIFEPVLDSTINIINKKNVTSQEHNYVNHSILIQTDNLFLFPFCKIDSLEYNLLNICSLKHDVNQSFQEDLNYLNRLSLTINTYNLDIVTNNQNKNKNKNKPILENIYLKINIFKEDTFKIISKGAFSTNSILKSQKSYNEESFGLNFKMNSDQKEIINLLEQTENLSSEIYSLSKFIEAQLTNAKMNIGRIEIKNNRREPFKFVSKICVINIMQRINFLGFKENHKINLMPSLIKGKLNEFSLEPISFKTSNSIWINNNSQFIKILNTEREFESIRNKNQLIFQNQNSLNIFSQNSNKHDLLKNRKDKVEIVNIVGKLNLVLTKKGYNNNYTTSSSLSFVSLKDHQRLIINLPMIFINPLGLNLINQQKKISLLKTENLFNYLNIIYPSPLPILSKNLNVLQNELNEKNEKKESSKKSILDLDLSISSSKMDSINQNQNKDKINEASSVQESISPSVTLNKNVFNSLNYSNEEQKNIQGKEIKQQHDLTFQANCDLKDPEILSKYVEMEKHVNSNKMWIAEYMNQMEKEVLFKCKIDISHKNPAFLSTKAGDKITGFILKSDWVLAKYPKKMKLQLIHKALVEMDLKLAGK